MFLHTTLTLSPSEIEAHAVERQFSPRAEVMKADVRTLGDMICQDCQPYLSSMGLNLLSNHSR
jgi:hypothetical protein